VNTPDTPQRPSHAISRRRALTTLGTVSLGGLLAACSSSSSSESSATTTLVTDEATGTSVFDGAASCILSPEMTEGPYYFDVDAIRSDIREDRTGVPLRLALRVQDVDACAPISDAVVDVWHCDANGLYSGFEAASTGRGNARDDETYLRGAQVTNGAGAVEFVTVYPGWYRGRTTHIHVKVHLDRSTLLTSQLYFDEEVNDAVYRREPYASDDGRDTRNDDDTIFDEQMVLTITPDGDGYVGAMTLGVNR
jgi:protocatechuate 3,4-dioxygenase beta subunit